MNISHGLWIGGKLSLMEKLTIKSLQSFGYEFHLWTYSDVSDVPSDVIVEDGREILNMSTMFKFNGMRLHGLPNGGIGSLSHWSDQFALELLYQKGGLYTQMDVTYLKPLDKLKEYAFIPHGNGNVGPYMMKCPKNSEFAKIASAQMRKFIHADSIVHAHWDVSMQFLGVLLKEHLQNYSEYMVKDVMDLGCSNDGPFFRAVNIPNNMLLIHWSNATLSERKDSPIVGSTYETLLKQHNLI